MADATPQLKRKGEEVAQRKAKKQRKNEAAAVRDGRNGVETPAPATPKSKNTPAPKKQLKSTPNTNDVSADATIDTPTIPQQDDGNAVNAVEETGEADDSRAPTTPDLLHAAEKMKPKTKKSTPAKAEDADMQDTPELSKSALKKKQKKEQKERNRAKRHELLKPEEPVKKGKTSESWVTSPTQGGWFLPTDPIFSPDEKYLILANLKSLRIYATESSLLANTLPVGEGGVLTAYALSSTKPNQVYVADSTNQIALWDWVSGKNIARWFPRATVQHMVVVTKPESDDEILYCVDADQRIINVRALQIKPKSNEDKHVLKQILETDSTIRGIQVLLQGKYVVVASDDSITVGKRVKVSKTELQDFEYVWREFKFAKRITTFNAYYREPLETGKGKKPQDQRDVIDIAVGDETGVVLLFEDILASFAAIEKGKKDKDKVDTAEGLRPKRLHWHRDAVGAVKWSSDGNYLVSGGHETVLTIWQLATGLPQHLPHLSAAIENVVVSPTGSAYALSLANNSVIVLSTTELEAKTNIVGIQSRRIDFEQMPKESKSGKKYLDMFNSVPLTVNPKKPSEVLFSVPSSQPRQKKGKGLHPEPYLQTFDLANQRPQARQALTRNTATEPNVAPEGGQIKEPNVTHVQVSHDGEWLATVDEWVPPPSDSGYLNEGIPEYNEQERFLRREIYLKIWRRDKDNAQWKLEARIDAPHFLENVCGNGQVFDLVADPTAPGFATVGEDHVVRIWRPKTRTRDGVIVRGAQQEGLVTWSLDTSVEISDKLDITEGSQISLPPRTSCLAFSADGSVLAVSISWDSEEDAGVTHLIDTHTATIRRSLTEVDVTALSGLGFVGQCLVIVADAITVWDMVSDQLAYSFPIHTADIGRLERVSLVRLATNEVDNTFAVSLPQFAKSDSSKIKNASSIISIYSPDHHKPQWSRTCAGITLALASRKIERGYIALDSRSCFQTFTPSTAPLQLLTPPPEEVVEPITYGVEEEEEEKRPLASFLVSEDMTQDIERDEHVFNMQDLQHVLNDGSVPPPPQGLFNNILALVSGRQQKAAA